MTLEGGPHRGYGNRVSREVFAHRLKTLRVEAGLSQTRLAEMVGASQREISRYERALSVPRPERMEALANCLGVEVSDLYDRKEEAAPSPGARAAALVDLAYKRDPKLAAKALRILAYLLSDEE